MCEGQLIVFIGKALPNRNKSYVFGIIQECARVANVEVKQKSECT
jgi:hypothetical protein